MFSFILMRIILDMKMRCLVLFQVHNRTCSTQTILYKQGQTNWYGFKEESKLREESEWKECEGIIEH